MDSNIMKTNKRYAWFAAFLSLLMPGLGQLYCGAITKCLCLLALTNTAAMLSLLALVPRVRLDGTVVVLFSGFSLVIYGVGILDAFLTARRTRADYALKDYNRWYAYLLLSLAASAGNIFSVLYVRDNLLMPFRAGSDSMYPAVCKGDKVFAARNAYREKDPVVGDIVVFLNPEDRRQIFLKRVVALAGDEVEIRNGELFVNGTKLKREEAPVPTDVPKHIGGEETYFYEINGQSKYQFVVTANGNPRWRSLPSTIVPKHQCFVLGDYRDNSLDSRNFGAIPIAGIVGKVSFIYEPVGNWSRFGTIR